MASEDMKGSDSQFEFDISLKDSSTLVLYVKDKKNLRKFTATYTANTLAAKGLTQSIDKFFKILKTASKNKKDNWSMQYGYSTKPKSKTSVINTKEDKIDLLKKYLRKFTATYTANTLAAKGLTQSIDKFFKILKTASKNKKDNWSMQYGYSTKPKSKTSVINTKEDKIDLLKKYLRKFTAT
eukprot:889478_1